MPNPVSQQILICASCKLKRFSGSSFRYVCQRCDNLFCRDCAGYSSQPTSTAKKAQTDFTCATCNQHSSSSALHPSDVSPADKSDINNINININRVLSAIANVNTKVDSMRQDLNTLNQRIASVEEHQCTTDTRISTMGSS
eukprot:GHVN01009863.1.p1 GENE.GHVN01009863.1~~GHVN01009863.1.p1  ORF type:complete len:141 (-),score=5.65 GHVN01009863.1:91-513(-)